MPTSYNELKIVEDNADLDDVNVVVEYTNAKIDYERDGITFKHLPVLKTIENNSLEGYVQSSMQEIKRKA